MINMHQVISRLAALSPSTLAVPVANRFSVPEDARTTEYGNSLRFVHHSGKDVFYHHDKRRWFIWNGRCWEIDSREQIKHLAVESINKIRDVELPYIYDQEEKAVLSKWISKSLSKTKINNVIDMAQGMLPVPSPLDANKYLLNVLNGTIRLKTGELLPHDRTHYLTKMAHVEFRSDAQCPRWEAFLRMVFEGNEGVIGYFQKVLGYCLTGDTGEKCFFICYGPGGNNGKTLIINVMRSILGADYCAMVNTETLVAKRFQNHIRTDLVRLQGARFVSASETDRQYRFDEGLVKALSGGDAITAGL